MAIDPLKLTQEVRKSYIRYLTSTFRIRNPKLQELFKQQIDQFPFTNGPIIEATAPFEKGCYLRDLIGEGLISDKLLKLTYPRWKNGIQKNPLYKLRDNPLFLHQEKAIRKLLKGRNLVIASGTASGKTECFLIPILNHLIKEYENGNLTPGVRAILIYPMNALANDQLRRLREIARVMEEQLPEIKITFGRYVGDTPDTRKEGEEKFRLNHPGEEPVKSELLSREEMRESPPHILLTNYAMLEYLLIRPEDSPFFDGEHAKHWKFLVLDEAHIYSGAMGIEIAMLIRRLKDRVCKNMQGDIQCIATSATLVKEEEDFSKVAEFATNLFGEIFEWGNEADKQDIIKGYRQKISNREKSYKFPLELYNRLNEAISKSSDDEKVIRECENICKHLNLPDHIVESAKEKAKGKLKIFLYDLLRADENLLRLRICLEESSKDLKECIRLITEKEKPSEDERQAVLNLINLAVFSHYDEDLLPLLPARYHLFVRAPEGIFVAFYPQPRVFLDRKQQTEDGYPVFELATCRRCGQEYLVGNIDENGKLKHVFSELDTARKERYFLLWQEDISIEEDEDQEVAIPQELAEKGEIWKLCTKCGSIWTEEKSCNCDAERNTILKVIEVKPKSDVLNTCLSCGLRSIDIVREFTFQQDAPSAVLATALYQNLKKNKKILCFSDSRQDAAFFAPYLEFTYKKILFRRLIVEALKKNKNTKDYRLNSLCHDVLYIANEKNIFDQAQDDKEKRKEVWKWIIQDFCGLWDRRNSLEGVGLISFLPIAPENWKPIENLMKPPWNLTRDEAISLYQILLNTMRLNFAITFPDDGPKPEDEFFSPRNHDYKFRGEKSDKNRGIYSFIPPSKGKHNARLEFLLKLYEQITGKQDGHEQCRNLLGEIWNDLSKNWTSGPIYQYSDSRDGVLYKLDYRYWRIIQESDHPNWYACNRCGSITPIDIKGVCPTFNCKGKLEVIDNERKKELYDNHYRHLYTHLSPFRMTSKEHTAQLTPDYASKIQQWFINGNINVLSCSTTFELGVDLGELEAIFLRNVPPEPSNYIQRAGRAGRRLDTIGFILTFAQLRSHDLSYFKDPYKMVEGRIKPPAVDISNEKIIARHISSIVLAEFFKGNKSFYGNVKNFFRFETPQDSGTIAVKNFLYNKPPSVLNSLKRILPENMQKVFDIDNWKWIEDFIGEEGRLTLADKVIRDEHKKLKQYYENKEEEWKNTKDQQKRSKITRDMDWASRRLSEIEKRPLIDFLASHIVIPKYGFPVDVVALDIIYKKIEKAKEIELERDLRMAISEFAPTSQVVANGYIWKSYGLKAVKEKTWPLYWYAICPMCKRFLIKQATIDEARPEMKCPIHGVLENRFVHTFVIPIFGFVTSRDADPISPGESRPPHEFTTRPYFFGGYKMPEEKQIELVKFKIKCKYSKDGELAVVCRGKGAGFWICFECGAAFSKSQKNHKTPFGQECNNKTFGPFHLGHTFKTDILSVSFKQPEMPVSDANFWYSLLYAILEGTSQALGIKRQDLDGCLFPSEDGISLILFDNVPGGAGHVKRLMDIDNFRESIESALNRVKNCSCGLETSCYGCLRNYQNQFCHDQLNRGKVLKFLENGFK
jgi:ATP-dependent helicase YprA (DUF1998 family)